MRSSLDEVLAQLNRKMIELGAMCESIIALVASALLDCDTATAATVIERGKEIDRAEREIEGICLRLLLRQQPVARDLRTISSALKMITDMERIGDQAEDIAEMVVFLNKDDIEQSGQIRKMAKDVIKMVNDSVDAYVRGDVELARAVCRYDDVVDESFVAIKRTLIKLIENGSADGEHALDILMIAKYFERIGDHAVNIAQWVEFSVNGVHDEVK